MIKKVIRCMVCENRVADFFVEILIISLLRHWPAGCSGMGGRFVHPKKAYSRNWGHRGGIWDRIESCFSFNFTRPKINIFFMLAIACGMEYFVYLCSPFRSLREEIIFHRVATI
jgi:hypothetical protein